MKTPQQDNRARTPRRKTPLNADTNESETNFSYTGNDGRQHIMPNFIPTYDPETGRKYSKPDRIKMNISQKEVHLRQQVKRFNVTFVHYHLPVIKVISHR
jgi:hypothetical protein